MGIGKDNGLLFHLKKDLLHFKKETEGKMCVFGRKTYESLPVKPLPNRSTFILTKDDSYKKLMQEHDNVFIYDDVEKILFVHDVIYNKNQDLYVCGGSEVNKLLMPYIDEMIITFVDADREADTFFPNIKDIDSNWNKETLDKFNDSGLDCKIIKFKKQVE